MSSKSNPTSMGYPIEIRTSGGLNELSMPELSRAMAREFIEYSEPPLAETQRRKGKKAEPPRKVVVKYHPPTTGIRTSKYDPNGSPLVAVQLNDEKLKDRCGAFFDSQSGTLWVAADDPSVLVRQAGPIEALHNQVVRDGYVKGGIYSGTRSYVGHPKDCYLDAFKGCVELAVREGATMAEVKQKVLEALGIED